MSMNYITYDNCNPRLKSAIDWGREVLFNNLSGVDCWIAGGALRSFFSNQEPTDIDVYCQDQSTHAKILTQLEAKLKLKSHFTNRNTVTLGEFDIVKHFYSDPFECIDDFDFTICCAAVTKDELYIHTDFFQDLAARELICNNTQHSVKSIKRAFKYQSYGFTLPDKELIRLTKNCRDFDYKAWEEEQKSANLMEDENEFFANLTFEPVNVAAPIPGRRGRRSGINLLNRY